MANPFQRPPAEKLVDMGDKLPSHHLDRFISETLGVNSRDVKHMVLTIVPPGKVLVVLTRYERNEAGNILIDEFEDEPVMETRYGNIKWDWVKEG